MQGQHLNNVVVFTPVFWEGRLFGYSCVRAHLHDIGGAAIGSGSPSTDEIFQEGSADSGGAHLSQGQAQSRRSGYHRGEFALSRNRDGRSQRADGGLAPGSSPHFANCFARFGSDVGGGSHRQELGHDGKRGARDARQDDARQLYAPTSFLDNDGVSNKPVHISVRVDVTPERMIDRLLRHRRSSRRLAQQRLLRRRDERRPHRLQVLDDAASAFERRLFPAADDHLPRRARSSMRAGPAAMYEWSVIFPTVIDTVLKAIADAAPGRVPAATRGDPRGVGIRGFDAGAPEVFQHAHAASGRPRRAARITTVRRRNVRSSKATSTACRWKSTKRNITSFSIAIALRNDSAGAGRFRGGFGTDVVVQHAARLGRAQQHDPLRSVRRGASTAVKRPPATRHILLTPTAPQRMSRRVDYQVPAGQQGADPDRRRRRVRDRRSNARIETSSTMSSTGTSRPQAAERDYGVVVGSDGVVDDAHAHCGRSEVTHELPRLATDVGGTFTDLASFDSITNVLTISKASTTLDVTSGVGDDDRKGQARSGARSTTSFTAARWRSTR